MRTRIAAAAWAVGLAMLAGLAEAATAALKMDVATQRRLGIATTPLAAIHRADGVAGFARVLDPTPLAILNSEIAQAGAALAASQAEAVRTRALNAADQTVSKRAAEAAAAQARADAAKLQLLRRRLGLEWGPAFAALSDSRRDRLVGDIAAGRAALVRIDATAPSGLGAASAEIDLGLAGRGHATLMGPTRSGDPRLQSTGLLGVVRGPAALRLGVGTVAPASLSTGSGASGVIIPRAALLRTDGRTFAYVRRDATSFERRALVGAVTDPAGLFVATGFRPGEPVVIAGAAQLFAAERPAQGVD